MKSLMIWVLCATYLMAQLCVADATSRVGSDNPPKQNRELLKVVLPAQTSDDQVRALWTDDSYVGHSSTTWHMGASATEYSIPVGTNAKRLKILLYRRGFKIITREFDASANKAQVWTPAFDKLPETSLMLHLTDAVGAPIAGEKLRLGFTPNFSTYPREGSSSSMGLAIGTLWTISEGETDTAGNMTLAVPELAQDAIWMKRQDANHLILARLREPPPRNTMDFGFSMGTYLDDRVYLCEPITAKSLGPETLQVKRLFLTPLKIEITQKFLQRKGWTKELFASTDWDKERNYIVMVADFALDEPLAALARSFYRGFSGLSLNRKTIQRTSALVGDAKVPLSFSGNFIPGAYDIEVQISHYTPAKNGIASARFLRREVLQKHVVVTENTPRVLTLE